MSARTKLPEGAVDIALERLFPTPNPYTNDPKRWVNERLGEYIWSAQTEIMESVRDNKYTAVPSCHGPGKSFIAARTAACWLDTHPPGSAFVVTTAPTWQQVQAILWREIRRAHRKGRLPGRITLECQWYHGSGGNRNFQDDELIGMGRKPADYDQSAFQGIHARYVLVIIDEACGVPRQLYDAVDSLVTNNLSRVLAIGNPDDPASHFKTICEESSHWNVIPIPAHITPNFTGEYVPEDVADQLVSPEWVEERRRDWGEGSPLWQSKVMAEFPDVSDDTLLSPALIAAAVQRDLAGLTTGQYGLDIARLGADETVCYRNRGGVIRLAWRHHKADTVQTATRAMSTLDKHHAAQSTQMIIDITGVGGGVYDQMRHRGYRVIAHESAARAYDPQRFANRRAEVYWGFKDLMEDGAIDLDGHDEELLAQLAAVKWGIDQSGRVYIESKDDMRKRGLPSPDRADACVMSTVNRGAILRKSMREPETITGDLLTRVM